MLLILPAVTGVVDIDLWVCVKKKGGVVSSLFFFSPRCWFYQDKQNKKEKDKKTGAKGTSAYITLDAYGKTTVNSSSSNMHGKKKWMLHAYMDRSLYMLSLIDLAWKPDGSGERQTQLEELHMLLESKTTWTAGAADGGGGGVAGVIHRPPTSTSFITTFGSFSSPSEKDFWLLTATTFLLFLLSVLFLLWWCCCFTVETETHRSLCSVRLSFTGS